jgi:prephenate dehydrogenase
MMLDILLTNREAVLKALRDCDAQVHVLARLLEAGDEEGLRAMLAAARDRRTHLAVPPGRVKA